MVRRRSSKPKETLPKTFQHFLDRSLSHVVRFSGKPQHFHESVVEHSFYVTYFVAIICHLLRDEGEEIDEAKALKIALVHDMEEAFSGDIIGPFKHYNAEVLGAIRRTNKKIISQVFEDLPKDIASEFISLWKEDLYQKTKEAQVVKLADDLSQIAKCYEEMKVGNEFFSPIYQGAVDKLTTLKYPWWKKISRKVLPQAS
jgi:putative hydrolase of HD superfamily